MEERFKSLSLFEFSERFKTKDDCLSHLSKLKWKEGYECIKCKNKKWCEIQKPHYKRCTKCGYAESPTANTLFHKVKFDLVKAFYIVYFVSTNKKGISSTELSRKLELRQKTCWLFKRKVMKAMESGGEHPLREVVEVDETFVGGSEKGVKGRQKGHKKLVVVAVEKKKKGVSRFYAQVIEKADAKSLGAFMDRVVENDAQIKTDMWKGHRPLKQRFKELTQTPSGKYGENFPDMHRVIMNFKSWLRGIHHNVRDLQEYINEYSWRFNRSFMKETIFDRLVETMVAADKCTYKMIVS